MQVHSKHLQFKLQYSEALAETGCGYVLEMRLPMSM